MWSKIFAALFRRRFGARFLWASDCLLAVPSSSVRLTSADGLGLSRSVPLVAASRSGESRYVSPASRQERRAPVTKSTWPQDGQAAAVDQPQQICARFSIASGRVASLWSYRLPQIEKASDKTRNSLCGREHRLGCIIMHQIAQIDKTTIAAISENQRTLVPSSFSRREASRWGKAVKCRRLSLRQTIHNIARPDRGQHGLAHGGQVRLLMASITRNPSLSTTQRFQTGRYSRGHFRSTAARLECGLIPVLSTVRRQS
jgi:hypothetical protein